METQTINNTGLLPSDYWNEKLTDDECFARLELGYVFRPTDAEIIVALLIKKKIKNEKLPRNQVKLGNRYKIDPKKLAGDYGKLSTQIWYLFTIRDRKYQNENINVSTVDGYWKVKGDDENMEHNGETVGFRKTFQFYRGKPGSSSKTSWLMHEFRVIDLLPSVEGQKSWRIGFCVRYGTRREAGIMRTRMSTHQLDEKETSAGQKGPTT